jgi:hypothetical protein
VPTDLNYFAIFGQDRNGALTLGQRQQTLASGRVLLDIVFNELRSLPLEPLTHFLGVGTT